MNKTKLLCLLLISSDLMCLSALAQAPKVGANPPAAATANPLPPGVPDVQVMVGPGVRGYTVAFVFPKAVSPVFIKQLVERFAKVSGSPVSGLSIETSRLDRPAGSKVEAAPLMSSVTFESKAELVDRPAGRFSPEPFIEALDYCNRVNVTFLIDQAFIYKAGTKVTTPQCYVELFGQSGAYTFVANILRRPVMTFRFPDTDAIVVKAKAKPKQFPIGLVVGGIVLSGCLVGFAVRIVLNR